jgi:hypothetical protein
MERAVSGKPPQKDFCIYQTIDVPPGDYRVDVLAYVDSVTVGLHEDNEDLEPEEMAEKYKQLPTVRESYVVQLTPLKGDLPLPQLTEETNWPGVFEFRRS